VVAAYQTLHTEATTVEELIADLTTEEKVSLLSGADGWHTQNIPRLGIGFLKVKS
jgi:hypothetical protein